MFVQSPLQRREKRQETHRWVHLGVMACGWATGLVEFLALQRSRLQRPHHRVFDVRRPSGRPGG
ncbi:hypothetical protein [Hydrogenophaga sp. SL48]|jgi:hypothetical protein|uniref:hypothetical protein n=1 Tax=Hydrogenophaga sp. SL48 TaxID=2806347 RepID=UPI001F2334F0|nr:hypothetical protein [Hydrogenophaga sp. SL48]UJW83227.1 hypothetical protein IM738_11440 [Hydrogenophaga sp. SL48]